jgi:hypothetical protein
MERIPNRPEPEPDPDEPEYPAGTEVPTEPPGLDPDAEDEQPGFSEDPPQAD